MKNLKFVAYLFCACIGLSFFTACSSGSSSGEPILTPSEPVAPKTPSKGAPTWGERDCQKNKSCENLVLNLSFDQWKSVLEQTQLGLGTSVSTQAVALHCGAALYKAYRAKTNLSRELTDAERFLIVDFAKQTLVLETCTVTGNLRATMNRYLETADKLLVPGGY